MAKVTKSAFLEKAVQAHEQHKADDTKAGRGGELPGGIENGIAQLTSVKIGVYQKGDYEGEPFFMGMGTVVSPKFHEKLPVAGLLTSIGPIPLCDTTKANGDAVPFAENWDRMLRHLRSLGLDTKTIEPTDLVSGIDTGEYSSGPILEALSAAGPKFRFRTWAGAKLEQTNDGKWRVGRKTFPTKDAALKANPYSENPKVFHEWGDAVEYTEAPADAVQDDTQETPKWESDDKTESEAAVEAPPQEEVQAESAETTDTTESSIDFVALAKIADDPKASKKDKIEAERALTGHAKLFNIDYESAASWAVVATQVLEAMAAQSAETTEETVEETVEEEEYSEEPEEWKPINGEIGFFNDPKAKAPVKCEFVAVDEAKEKADIKRLDTNKVVKGVPFAKLMPTEIPF